MSRTQSPIATPIAITGATPIAITGARGRLGRALVTAGGARSIAWGRPDYDLDRPDSGAALLARDRPALVIHAAAMTAVDECARQPRLAMRRNADAAGTMAAACASARVGLVLISTNEVFDGERGDGRGYGETDPPRPRNAYGASKLAGEQAAQDAFGDADGLWIVRTSWLFGPPGSDFPDKIVAAADRLPDGEALPVVADEHGSPTSTADLATAILAITERTPGGVYHLVNAGHVSRLGWARRVLVARRPGRGVRAISRSSFERASDPPPWGVLDTARAAAAGVTLRPWDAALGEYLGSQD